MVGAQLGGVLDQHDALVRRYQRQQAGQQRRLAGAGATRDHEGQPGRHDGTEQSRPGGVDGTGGDQLGQRERPAAQGAQGQVRAGGRDRRQHRVQSGTVREPGIRERRPLVQPTPRGGREPLGEPAHLVHAAERDRCADQSGAPVDPDLAAVDEDVGDRRVPQQAAQRPGRRQVVGQRPGQQPGTGHRQAGH
jgi:hypothetical protein